MKFACIYRFTVTPVLILIHTFFSSEVLNVEKDRGCFNLLTLCFISFSLYAVLFPFALCKPERLPGTYLDGKSSEYSSSCTKTREIKF